MDSQIPFRVFSRVPAPGVKDNELFIPQYYTQGQWSSWPHPVKGKIAFSNEREAQLYLIGFVKNKVEKVKQRISILETEVKVLADSLIQLNRDSIGIVARNPEK